ncbi:hypothetical protein [Candidatus Parabeggiatoa sp. HSG14]|uniref:hypothetical protein n=1 Tax=Candidatus Parabeggiatoa sp. HSG14 TaxID=3055593 RepID=UPI0025A7A8A7|nr:hypothetical protein [Thiotrichales bacterium HSG14]
MYLTQSGNAIYDKKWNIISDWIAPDYELTRSMAQASAQKYANEKGIAPRDCSKMSTTN